MLTVLDVDVDGTVEATPLHATAAIFCCDTSPHLAIWIPAPPHCGFPAPLFVIVGMKPAAPAAPHVIAGIVPVVLDCQHSQFAGLSLPIVANTLPFFNIANGSADPL
jgi:hypothetical protein